MRPLSFLSVVLLAGCAGEKTSPQAIEVRDSAGIQIVQHPAGYEATLPVWTVGNTPALDIGTEPGEELHRVGGAARLSDGRIVVINRGTGELRLFDSAGRRTQTIGKLGEGPGEFSNFIQSVQVLAGDTLFVLDGQNRRASWFSPTGSLLRTASVGSLDESHMISVLALVADRLLASDYHHVPMRETDGPVRRDSFAIVLMRPGDRTLDTVIVVPSQEVYPSLGSEGGQEFPTIRSLQFGRTTDFSTNGTHFVVGTNEPGGIRIFDTQKRLMRLVRSATADEPITDEIRKQREQEELARFQRAPEQMKAAWMKYLRFASVLPQHERVLLGTDGSVWLERARHYADEGRRFVVYDTTGKAIATVRCPDRMRPYQVGPREIIGLWRDPDDVEHVRVYAVVREPR